VAVKPHQVTGALSALGPEEKSDRLFISIAAGVSLSALRSLLSDRAQIVRVIPNLPAMCGYGVTLVTAPEGTREEDRERAREIFSSVGTVHDLPESLFDQGTGVSGSGPAYFFLVMESMVRGAVRLGLSWDISRELVLRTALGSAQAALANPDLCLSELRDQVTSPGGTTAEGLLKLEEGRIAALFQQALEAAAEKGKSLA
jgi:pyrroline-5-carboxylate reductase